MSIHIVPGHRVGAQKMLAIIRNMSYKGHLNCQKEEGGDDLARFLRTEKSRS